MDYPLQSKYIVICSDVVAEILVFFSLGMARTADGTELTTSVLSY